MFTYPDLIVAGRWKRLLANKRFLATKNLLAINRRMMSFDIAEAVQTFMSHHRLDAGYRNL